MANTDIVQGLFGVSPDVLRQQRMAQQEAMAKDIYGGTNDPFDRVNRQLYASAGGLMSAAAPMLGIQDQAMQEAQGRQDIQSQADLSSPQGAYSAAKMAKDRGDNELAIKLVQYARQMEAEQIKSAQTQAQTQKDLALADKALRDTSTFEGGVPGRPGWLMRYDASTKQPIPGSEYLQFDPNKGKGGSGGGDMQDQFGGFVDLGMPVPRTNLYSAIPDPKVRAQTIAKQVVSAQKNIDDAAKEAQDLQNIASKYQQFGELNAKYGDTGGAMDKSSWLRTAKGLDSTYNNMLQISSELTPMMRVSGSGSTSDFDAKMFQQATVGVDKPKAVNDNIIEAKIAQAKQAADYAQYINSYVQQNKTAADAQKFWNEYKNENPIFVKPAGGQANGTFKVNRNRMSFEEWYAKKQGRNAQVASQPAASSLPSQDAIAAELARRRGK